MSTYEQRQNARRSQLWYLMLSAAEDFAYEMVGEVPSVFPITGALAADAVFPVAQLLQAVCARAGVDLRHLLHLRLVDSGPEWLTSPQWFVFQSTSDESQWTIRENAYEDDERPDWYEPGNDWHLFHPVGHRLASFATHHLAYRYLCGYVRGYQQP